MAEFTSVFLSWSSALDRAVSMRGCPPVPRAPARPSPSAQLRFPPHSREPHGPGARTGLGCLATVHPWQVRAPVISKSRSPLEAGITRSRRQQVRGGVTRSRLQLPRGPMVYT